MKVDQAGENAEKRAADDSFQRTMTSATLDALRRKPPSRPKLLVVPLPRGVPTRSLKNTDSLQVARARMHVEAARLVTMRSEGVSQAKERRDERLIERVAQELQKEKAFEPTLQSGPFTPQADLTGTNRATEPAPTAPQFAATVALVERIEQLIRAGRPALSFSLGGAFNAEVDVERTGRNEVALQIRGRRGPPPPQDLSRLRHELQNRGLTLKSLTVT